MIRITNVKWQTGDFNYMNDIITIIQTRLNKLKIKYNLQVLSDKTIEFRMVNDPNAKQPRLFFSVVENKSMLEPGNPKIEKLGRDYMLTRRVTKAQYDGFFKTIEEIFDDLGLMADITYRPSAGDQVTLRSQFQKFPDNYPKVKSFPVEK